MELQLEKYQNLIHSLSSKMTKTNYFSDIDFEQELWLKLYEFIKNNSGEADNFPLIKTVLRVHILELIRGYERMTYLPIEDLIEQGAILIYPGFAPNEAAEIGEVVSFVNEWFLAQSPKIQNFILCCLKDMDGNKVSLLRGKREFPLTENQARQICVSENYRIIHSLKKFLKQKGVKNVFKES